MSNYKILKIPISREKSVFYYYKQYEPKKKDAEGDKQLALDNLIELPVEKTIYICHFLRPIQEEFIKKYFGLAGKIKQIHMGEYKSKGNNKRQRRAVYFGIVVYKNAEDASAILTDPKSLQSQVNKLCKKTLKFSLNPLDDSGSEEEVVKDAHTDQMEEGGFTIIAPEKEGDK